MRRGDSEMLVPLIVAGVDVGGRAKGCHAVALQDGSYFDQFASNDVAAIAAWCRRIGALTIGVDAPCRWSDTGRARAAERALMATKIWCFSTPSKAMAETHPKDHFRWMLNGAALFAELETTHPLFDGVVVPAGMPVCFETFPQAIACALTGSVVSAKHKRIIRRGLLDRSGISTAELKNIDQIDAALCALTAHYLALGLFKAYGEAATGVIVVPRDSSTS